MDLSKKLLADSVIAKFKSAESMFVGGEDDADEATVLGRAEAAVKKKWDEVRLG